MTETVLGSSATVLTGTGYEHRMLHDEDVGAFQHRGRNVITPQLRGNGTRSRSVPTVS
jgi:hypothetical protein